MASEDLDLGRLEWGVGPFSVSAEREALRRQIVEAPYDDALRRAYADMAQAEGDPRGAYVRLALAREGASPRDAVLIDRRLVDLRARYGRAIYAEWFPSPHGRWLGRLLSTPSGGERAGFVHHVAAHDAGPTTFSLLERSELQSLASLTPLESVHFASRTMPLGDTRIRDLGPVDNGYLDEEQRMDVRRVSGRWSAMPSVPLTGCQDLRVSYVGDDPGFAARVAETMPALRAVSLRNVDSEGLRALGQLPDLEQLSMSCRSCRDMRDIFAAPGSFPSLRSVDIWESTVDPTAIAELVRSREITALTIELNHGFAELLAALDGAALTELSIYGTPDLMPEIGFAPFATANLPRLRRLSLSELQAGPDIQRLAEAPLAQHLESLGLNGMEIGPELVEALAGASSFPRLQSLSLRSNPIGDHGARALAASDSFMDVVDLALSGNKMKEPGTRLVLASLRRVEHIDLGKILLGCQPLAWLPELPNLATLRSYRASRYDGSATEALDALASTPHASSLRDVSLPDLTEASAASVAAFVDSPHLAMLGSFPMHTQLSPDLMDTVLRRFGHRVALFDGPRLGSLPEPDLDPWWSG